MQGAQGRADTPQYGQGRCRTSENMEKLARMKFQSGPILWENGESKILV